MHGETVKSKEYFGGRRFKSNQEVLDAIKQ